MYVIAYDIGTTGLKTCLVFHRGQSEPCGRGTYQEYDL